MLHLLAKTVINFQAVVNLFPQEKVPANDPFSVIERASEIHTFWTIAFPGSAQLLEIFLEAGQGLITCDNGLMIVSANTESWHLIIRYLLADERKVMRQFATMVVHTFPDIFKTLSRSMNSDGTIALRK